MNLNDPDTRDVIQRYNASSSFRFRTFTQQRMANIPDTHVCNNLDSHFYQYTKKGTGDQLNQQAVRIKKKITSGLSGTNPPFDYISGPCFVFRVCDVTCDCLVLQANAFVLRENMCLRLIQCFGSVLYCCLEMSHSLLKFLRELGRILDIIIE